MRADSQVNYLPLSLHCILSLSCVEPGTREYLCNSRRLSTVAWLQVRGCAKMHLISSCICLAYFLKSPSLLLLPLKYSHVLCPQERDVTGLTPQLVNCNAAVTLDCEQQSPMVCCVCLGPLP